MKYRWIVMLKKCWPKRFVYSWCVSSDLIFMQIFHRVMQMDNIGWEPFETPTIPKIGNGSMGKQWRFLFGICQEATKIALDLTVQKAGYGLTLTVVSNSTSFANTVCSLFFSLSLSLFCFSINHYFIRTDKRGSWQMALQYWKRANILFLINNNLYLKFEL